VLPGVGQAAQHLGVDGVAHLGPVHGDDGDAVALLVQDCRFGHRSELRGQRSEPTTHMAKYCAPPPYACPSAVFAPSTWCAPARPITWSAAAPRRIMPDAPIGFVHSTPPEGLMGRCAPNFTSPRSTSFHPPPSSQKPRFSSHMASNHANGT